MSIAGTCRIVQSDQEFPIDFDEAWQWIGYSRKDAAKKVLIENFVQNIDFHISVEMTSSRRSDARLQKIKLTKDCFKAFCMLAKTEKGKTIRSYYLEIEKRFESLARPKSKAEALLQLSKMLTHHIELMLSPG